MASVTSVKSGSWSSSDTWDVGVPGNGDTVTIASNHTVTFDVDQSSFTNGLAGLTINGALKFTTAPDKSPYLKMGSGAYVNIYGSLYVGNSAEDPIPAYAGSDKDYRAKIHLQTSDALRPQTNSIFKCFGEKKPLNHTTLAADASADSTTIQLNEDLGLQPYEKIVVGAGSANGPMTETAKGIYTVSSYDSETKTVTLSSGLGHSRLAGDYVAVYSRPIRIENTRRIISAYDFFTTRFEGTLFKKDFFFPNFKTDDDNVVADQTTVHSSTSILHFSYCQLADWKNSTIYNTCINNHQNVRFLDCAFIQQDINAAVGFVEYPGYTLFERCLFENAPAIYFCYTDFGRGAAYFKSISARGLQSAPFHFAGKIEVMDSDLSNFTTAISRVHYHHRLCNTKANISVVDWGGASYGLGIESFNHNQVPGAYMAWYQGGTVQSQTSTVPPGKTKAYQYTLTSSYAPVHRTLELGRMEPGDRVMVDAWLRKSTTMDYAPRAYIFNTLRDPLRIKSEEGKLVEAALPSESVNEWKKFRLKWVNSTEGPVPVALRCEAKNDGGFVYETMKVVIRRRGGGVVII